MSVSVLEEGGEGNPEACGGRTDLLRGKVVLLHLGFQLLLRDMGVRCVPSLQAGLVQQPHFKPEDQSGRCVLAAEAQPDGPHAAAEEACAKARHCPCTQAGPR